MFCKLSDAEYRFMEEVWKVEPVKSSALVKICEEKFGWKKSTTYTVLKKLCERKIFQNTDGTVTSLIGRAEFDAMQSEQFVEETFGGSLPAFLAAFGTRKKLTDQEIDELQKVIDGMRR